MKVLVVGASHGTGAELVAELTDRGHLVTAYARRSVEYDDRVRHVTGDVLDPQALGKAMTGQDAVAVTLGIPDNPFRVRLTRRAGTPLDIRSRGTRAVIDSMREQGVRRLVVQSTYGIGDTYTQLPLALKAFFTLAIRPQVDDHALQERLVRESGLDWTLVRPTVLHDDPTDGPAYLSTDDQAPTMRVSRRQVAQVEADALESDTMAGRILTVTEPAIGRA